LLHSVDDVKLLSTKIIFSDVELKKYKESTENSLDADFTETSATARDVLFESRKEKLILNISSIILLLVLLFLWVWYR
jgi:hypothetical protein